MTTPWLQTGSGRAFDLLDPQPGSVDFAVDIAEALARIPRFTGHVRAGPYSVAQHCALGADLLFAETSRPDFAAAFLLHDAHEAYLGDIATPIVWAMDVVQGERGAGFGMCPSAAVRILKARLDQVIHERAGIAWPLPAETTATVKHWDARMLITERNQLMGKPPQPWGFEGVEPIKTRGAIKVWSWPTAAGEYAIRLRRWCPQALDGARP